LQLLRRVLRGLVQAVLLLVCGVIFYLMVIMGDTKTPDMAAEISLTAAPLAKLPQSPLEFTADTLYQAEYYFNAPILKLGGREWMLQKAVVQDTVPKSVGVSVREVRLRYTNADGAVVEVSSLTPARCLRVLSAKGFITAMDQEWMMAGSQAVFMKSGDTLHLHIVKGEVVYQIEGAVGLEALRKAAGTAEV